jgi:hypothetical protein
VVRYWSQTQTARRTGVSAGLEENFLLGRQLRISYVWFSETRSRILGSNGT